tara:strand:+ start:1725 stop:2342 length:618 start_codon:yes stop_codon:yes gene_type:complete
MATKRQLAEQIQRLVSGGDPKQDNEIDVREIIIAIDTCRDSLLTQYMSGTVGSQKNMDYSNTDMFSEVLSSETVTPSNGIALVKGVLSMPDNKSIFQVNRSGDLGSSLVRAPGSVAFWNQKTTVAGKYVYYVLRNANGLVEINIPGSSAPVDVYYVKETQYFADTDHLSAPFLNQQIVEKVVQMYTVMAQMPKDNLTDNVSKINR